MQKEDDLAVRLWQIPRAEEMYDIAKQIGEFAKAGTVLRSYATRYNMTEDEIAFESDGAHTNLMCAILDRALSYFYGPEFTRTSDGYSYRQIMEAARRHDLPENITGDIPDNGARDEDAKVRQEEDYQYRFSNLSPTREYTFEGKVKRLLFEMETKSQSTGMLLFLADKAAALIMALCYDQCNWAPLRYTGDDTLSERDIQEMELCDFVQDEARLGSEMWAADYFKVRDLVDMDEDGWITALIVMYTLQTKGKWYAWREKDYAEDA